MSTPLETTGQLKDKVALITGATGKLGRRLVEAFAGEGASVAFCSRRAQDLLPIEQGLRERGCTARPWSRRSESSTARWTCATR